MGLVEFGLNDLITRQTKATNIIPTQNQFHWRRFKKDSNEIVPGRISLTKVWASHKGKRYDCLFIFSICCSARQITDDSVKWAPWLRIDWYKLEQYKSEWLNSPVWATSSYYQWQPWFNLQWREINFFGTSVGIQWFECSQTSDLLPKLLVEGDESLYLPKW